MEEAFPRERMVQGISVEMIVHHAAVWQVTGVACQPADVATTAAAATAAATAASNE